MKPHQVHIYFNARILTNVRFGCGIVKFNKNQIKELKKIHELLMIRILGLGDNFPRWLLRVQKSSLGLVLIEPIMEIGMLAIKIFEENKILQGELSKVMVAHEELSFIDGGLTKTVRRQNIGKMYWNEGWVEEVDHKLCGRKVEK